MHRGISDQAKPRYCIPNMMKHPNGSQNNRGHTFSLKPGTTVMDGLMQHGLRWHARDKSGIRQPIRTLLRGSGPDSSLQQRPRATPFCMPCILLNGWRGQTVLVPKGRRLPPDGSFSGPERHVFGQGNGKPHEKGPQHRLRALSHLPAAPINAAAARQSHPCKASGRQE